jgi:uncharacterized membrane protein HdeD (DUF308 family)
MPRKLFGLLFLPYLLVTLGVLFLVSSSIAIIAILFTIGILLLIAGTIQGISSIYLRGRVDSKQRRRLIQAPIVQLVRIVLALLLGSVTVVAGALSGKFWLGFWTGAIVLLCGVIAVLLSERIWPEHTQGSKGR